MLIGTISWYDLDLVSSWNKFQRMIWTLRGAKVPFFWKKNSGYKHYCSPQILSTGDYYIPLTLDTILVELQLKENLGEIMSVAKVWVTAR